MTPKTLEEFIRSTGLDECDELAAQKTAAEILRVMKDELVDIGSEGFTPQYEAGAMHMITKLESFINSTNTEGGE